VPPKFEVPGLVDRNARLQRHRVSHTICRVLMQQAAARLVRDCIPLHAGQQRMQSCNHTLESRLSAAQMHKVSHLHAGQTSEPPCSAMGRAPFALKAQRVGSPQISAWEKLGPLHAHPASFVSARRGICPGVRGFINYLKSSPALSVRIFRARFLSDPLFHKRVINHRWGAIKTSSCTEPLGNDRRRTAH